MASNYEEDIDAFTTTCRREIVFYLRQLIHDGERINVMFDDGRNGLLSVLLDVDAEQDLLRFDWGGSEATNRALLNSEHAYFVANPIGVRNQFIADRIWESSYQGRTAFATRIPRKFVRLQRREFFRLALPIMHRPPCRFTVGDSDIEWAMAVVDIGLGGVCLESQGATLPFEVGQIIRHAVIDLDKFGKIETALNVRHIDARTHGTKQIARTGCQFVHLNPAQERDLQRFITHVQCEEHARLG
jgi:flagellar brake protein